MNRTRSLRALLTTFALASLIPGCGGGGGGSQGPQPLTITTVMLADGVTGTAYSAQLIVSGGSGIITWTVTAGTLPTGVSFSSTGAFSGIPTAIGTFNFTVQATDTTPLSVSRSFSIRIAAPLLITTAALPNGTTGVAYSQSLQFSAGTPSITWDLSAGTLPTGLTLAASTGAITGTPTIANTFNFTVRATDSATPPQVITRALSIQIVAGPPNITTTSLNDAVNGVAFDQTLQVAGGSGALTWTLSNGTLPTGLTLSTAGVISGSPSVNGTFNFTVRVTDSTLQTDTQALSIRVFSPLVISTLALPNGSIGVAYNQTVQSTGGTGSNSWTISAGSLPAGLTVNATTGAITGIPTTAATSNFTVRVADNASPQQVATQALSITIALSPIAIATSSLPTAVVNRPYFASLVASGIAPFTWSVTVGALPAGLTLSTTGDISGTPTATGNASFTVRVQDSGTGVGTRPLTLNIVAAGALGRNDSPATATVLSNGTFEASISPMVDPPGAATANPDQDFYSVTIPAGGIATIEIFADRLSPASRLDSVLQIVNSAGTRLTTCRSTIAGAFTQSCLNDDSDVVTTTLDSRLEFQNAGASPVTVFLHVLDFLNNARPDMRYRLRISGVQ